MTLEEKKAEVARLEALGDSQTNEDFEKWERLKKDIYKKEHPKEYVNKVGREQSEWYQMRNVLSYANWAMFYILLGAREAGKSYAVAEYFIYKFVHCGIPFYWLRLTEAQANKLLKNNAEKLADADIKRKYNLDLVTKGDAVYNVTKRDEKGKVLEKVLMCRVLALSTFYNDKGAGLFDADFLKDPNMWYHIILDEFEKEANERNQGDLLYQFVNQLENLIRSTKERTRIFIIGNTLERSSDILEGFGFIPEKFGIFKLKKKRAVIHYMAPTEQYKKRRKGTVADMLMPEASNFSNQIDIDKSLITKRKLIRPTAVLKFTRDKKDWFTMWDGYIVAPYKGEKPKFIIPLRPYIDEVFTPSNRDTVYNLYDTKSLLFVSLLVQKRFEKQLIELKPRK